MEESRTYLRNQAEYADEKHYKKPQSARWDHRVELEYDHAGPGMSAKWAIRNKASEGAERTLLWKLIHIAKRRKREHEVHALGFRSHGGVCLNRTMNEGDLAGGYGTHSYRPRPGHRSELPYETR